jgi:hypothetical protein
MIQHFKYIFLAAFLSITTAVHSGACILDGMNLWRLSENIACSVGSYCEITQDNFTAGITTPGHYKLCESLSGGDDTLDISASDVILDLGGYVLDSITVSISGGVSHVTVRNGIITNTRTGIWLNSSLSAQSDILIENITVDTVTDALAFANIALLALGNVTGLTIRNFTVYNGSFINIFLSNAEGSYEGVVLENISCFNTNPVFEVGGNEGEPVIWVQSCTNLVMRNIKLENQWEELNGILFDTCTDIDVDGVSITTTLSTPVTSTAGVQLTTSTVAQLKNIIIDSGTNNVFTDGFLIDSDSVVIMDSCEANLCSGTGFNIQCSNSIFENCIAQNNGTQGFNVSDGSQNQFINCTAQLNGLNGFVNESTSTACEFNNCFALYNGTGGFFISGAMNNYSSCSAIGNAGSGFSLLDDHITLENCITDSNGQLGVEVASGGTFTSIIGTNALIQHCDVLNSINGNGIDISVTGTHFGADGCVVEDSTINNNVGDGIIVRNILANAVYSSCAPNTIGSSFQVTNSRGVKLARNTILGNINDAVMDVSVTDIGILTCGTHSFTVIVTPPLGILNSIRNIIISPVFSTTGASTYFSVLSTVGAQLIAALDGNLVTG